MHHFIKQFFFFLFLISPFTPSSPFSLSVCVLLAKKSYEGFRKRPHNPLEPTPLHTPKPNLTDTKLQKQIGFDQNQAKRPPNPTHRLHRLPKLSFKPTLSRPPLLHFPHSEQRCFSLCKVPDFELIGREAQNPE